MKVIFIADLFARDLPGGAESNDKVLIDHLLQKHDVQEMHAHEASLEFLEAHKGAFFVFGNRTRFKHHEYVQKHCDYVIYEHDNQYLASRDPGVYVNYKAPKSDVLFEEFYRKAKAVIVLSKLHKECLDKNIEGVKSINIGCSLWSDESFGLLEETLRNCGSKYKGGAYGVIRWTNPIKGFNHAWSLLESKRKPAKIIEKQEPKSLFKEMHKCSHFVFMPKVVETFSRICCEAKMLGLDLVTIPSKLGFASEKEIYQMKGKPLIDEMIKRRDKAFALFERLIAGEDLQDITVILNVYRRPHLLEEQIQRVQAQTVQPKDVWVWVNHHEDNESFDFEPLIEKYGIKVVRSSHNFKYLGRFSLAYLAQTNFVALLDDDTMPAKRWFENCLNSHSKQPGVYGGIGVVLQSQQAYRPNFRIGWAEPNLQTERVDLVGHAWFFSKSLLKHLWAEEPYTYENGEDMHLSYTAQKYGGVQTFVPPHPPEDKELWSSLKGYVLGVDEVASSAAKNHGKFYNERDSVVQYYCENGWEIVKDN